MVGRGIGVLVGRRSCIGLRSMVRGGRIVVGEGVFGRVLRMGGPGDDDEEREGPEEHRLEGMHGRGRVAKGGPLEEE